MIITFSIANFRSFNEEVTFSMVASNRFSGSHENHLVSIPKTEASVLRAGVIYGANGAGKSNFFKALKFLRNTALKGRKKGKGTGRDVFRLGAAQDKESSFDLQFMAGDQLYRYGVVLDDEKIIEEWLLLIEGKREKVIYERTTDAAGNVSVKGKGLKGTDKKLESLAEVGGPKEQSFLATVRTTLERNSFNEPIRAVIDWFENNITLIEPDSNFLPLAHTLSEEPNFQAFASEFLRASSTGVDDLDVSKRELTEEELEAYLPSRDLYQHVLKNTEEKGKAIVGLGEDREVVVEKAGEHHYYLLTIQSVHAHEQDSSVRFDLSEESDGTRRLLNLIPALHRMQSKKGVFIIDEVERSMHPLLIYKFLEFFLSGCSGSESQLIVTTHESHLLDQDLLRRDEIWFTEKDKRGSTQMYSLADFQPRKDLKIGKHYLTGRFGAVPFLADMDKLIQKEGAGV